VAAAASADSWDMPTPYGDSTFHTQNIMQFAEDVAAATDGALEITVHSAGSLFPHGEIKNSVRSGQVPIGEFFLSTLVNENAAFGLDSQPVLATSYDDAARLWAAQEPVITELLAEQGLMPLFSVPWPAQGLYTNGEIKKIEDLSGLRFRRRSRSRRPTSRKPSRPARSRR
jgi:TRAP-type C4-dicarboxylate transport system substrate-binding protein